MNSNNLVSSIIHIACKRGDELMRFRRRLPRRRGPLPFRYVFIISFIIFILLTVQGLWIIEKGIKPALLSIAETRVNQIATSAINDAINKQIAERIDVEELTVIEKDNNGMITSVDFNPKVVTRVLSEATIRVQNNLRRVENGELDQLGMIDDVEIERDMSEPRPPGIVHNIPLGQATKNTLLANLGPKVPVRFTPIGSVKSDVVKKITEYGINNALLEISIHIEVSVKVVIPFATDTAIVKTDIPVAVRIIQGGVPQFYNNGSSNSPTMPGIIINQDE
jgi:sporulation protein YunB